MDDGFICVYNDVCTLDTHRDKGGGGKEHYYVNSPEDWIDPFLWAWDEEGQKTEVISTDPAEVWITVAEDGSFDYE